MRYKIVSEEGERGQVRLLLLVNAYSILSERKLTELTDDGFTSPGHADLLFYRKSRLDS